MGNAGKKYKEKSDIKKEITLKNEYSIEELGEANVCIKIAQWRARDLINKKSNENFQLDTYIKLQNILSKLKLENGFIIDPLEEKQIIDLYNNPERLREKFRSQVLDLLMRECVIIAQDEDLIFLKFKKKYFLIFYLMNQKLNNYISLSPLTLLYFYPKDDTPGCTLEASDFTRLKGEFESLGIQIIGISKDSEDSHTKFCNKHHLSIELISDMDESLQNQFGVIGEKKNYGKIYIGVIRSTFLLDKNGKILKEWRNVKATGHAEKVLREIKEIL